MADPVELRDAQLLENRKEVSPGFTVVNRDEPVVFSCNHQLLLHALDLFFQAIPSIPCIKSDFADGCAWMLFQQFLEVNFPLRVPLLDIERMDAYCGDDKGLASEVEDRFPVLGLCGVGDDSPDAIVLRDLEDVRELFPDSQVGQVGVCVVEWDHG